MCALRHVRLFAAAWTIAYQAPLSVEFSRQEYWSGLLFPTPGDLSDPGIKPSSLVSPPLAGDSLLLCHLEPAIRECLVRGLLVPGKQDCLFREIWEVPVPSLSPS